MVRIENTNVQISPTKPEWTGQIGFFTKTRKKVGGFLEYLWELTGSIRFYKIDVSIIMGSEKHTDEPMKTLYIGGYDNYSFIIGEMYSSFEVKTKYKKINSLRVRSLVDKYKNTVDIIFTDVELLYCKTLPRAEFIRVPRWIRQKYKVPDTWEEVLNSFRKNTKRTDLRKVRKYGFTYKITRSEDDYKSFYHHMHIPYIKKRFGDAAIIEPEWKFMRQCRKGELMQIIRNDKILAAVLFYQSAERLAYVWVGVPACIRGDIFKGVFSAMYYFTIMYGYESGCHEIDFLGTRPLLNNGLFRYKRKWGTYVQRSANPWGEIFLKPMKFNNAVKSFFTHNHFIEREGSDLVGKLLVDNQKVSKGDLEKIIKSYFSDGIKCLKVFSCLGFYEGTGTWAQKNFPMIKLIDLSNISQPQNAFCCT